jgi:hypothetical protein
MDGQLDDEALLRLLSAVVLHWWRECDEPGELAAFLDVPVDVVVSERPRRIDGWRRKMLERSD